MVVLELFVTLAAVTVVSLSVTAAIVVGPAGLSRAVRDYRGRLRTVLPYLALLGGVLAINAVVRRVGTEISWLIGWNITYDIYALEGTVVPTLQSFARPWLTTALSLAYVYGYVFLLIFPFVAYVALEDLEWFRTTALAYTVNYAIGLVCYLLFIAYGPRNLLPDLVDSLLYANWPSSQFLTREVNTNTNVFPSLHTSLSVTVMVLAYRTRREYPRWLPIAAVVGSSIVLSTMYLGIHWATDVLAGIVLGAGSVTIAIWLVDRRVVRRGWACLAGWVRAATGRVPFFS